MRNTLIALAGIAALLGAVPAQAQTGAARPLRIIVPFGPGTGTDILARVVGERAAELLGTTAVIENREGAGGLVGASATAKSPADGQTLMMAANPFIVAPLLQASAPYDAVRDFAPVARIGVLPMALVTGGASPFASVRDMIAHARANPGRLNYASSGKGTPSHLEMEQIAQAAGLRIQDVPYKSTAQAMTDTISGQVSLYFSTLPPALVQYRAGKLRILGIGSARRVAQAPEVPTLAEALGQPGYEASVWYGFVAPAGTPRDALARIADAVARALEQPAIRERVEKSGTEIDPAGPDGFGAQLRREHEKWAALVKTLGLAAN
ncbi:MAG: tripartite tricarboxylate transporter substrate binding protein [Burkholderiales bacterium]|nr:tripartite tricarboxylate transporter substrate binding protein [Burkholderiales bacterium]